MNNAVLQPREHMHPSAACWRHRWQRSADSKTELYEFSSVKDVMEAPQDKDVMETPQDKDAMEAPQGKDVVGAPHHHETFNFR